MVSVHGSSYKSLQVVAFANAGKRIIVVSVLKRELREDSLTFEFIHSLVVHVALVVDESLLHRVDDLVQLTRSNSKALLETACASCRLVKEKPDRVLILGQGSRKFTGCCGCCRGK